MGFSGGLGVCVLWFDETVSRGKIGVLERAAVNEKFSASRSRPIECMAEH